MSLHKPYVPPPRKRRRYSKVNYPIKMHSFPDIPWVVPQNYFPCPHIHLQLRPYNRDILTSEEHFNLLSTPKGYRWYGKNNNVIRRANEGIPGKKRLLPKKPPFPGFRQFMAELWNVLTPEMIEKLKNILEEEFNMSSEDAVKLLLKQRAKAFRLAKEEVLGPAPRVKGPDICWARDMASILAEKVTQISELMTLAPRSRRTRKVKARLIPSLHQLVGLEDEGPVTPVRSMLYKLGEVLAVWLNTLPGESDLSKICDKFTKVYSTISLI